MGEHMSMVESVEAENTKRRILDAAAECFMLQGFRVTTIDDIAEGVGATKGLVYYHFKSKFDILLSAYEHGMRQVGAQVAPLASLSGDARSRLEAMCVAHVLNLMSDLKYHHVIHLGLREQTSHALRPRQRESLEMLNRLRKEYEHLFLRVVEQGITEGSLRSVPAQLATRTLLSSLNAVDSWFSPRPGQSPAEIRQLAEDIVDVVLSGLV